MRVMRRAQVRPRGGATGLPVTKAVGGAHDEIRDRAQAGSRPLAWQELPGGVVCRVTEHCSLMEYCTEKRNILR